MEKPRKKKGFCRGLIPRDELDFVLSSPYNHTGDTFPDKVDIYLQPETYGVATWRRLRNVKEIPPPPPIQFEFRPKKSKAVAYNDVRWLLVCYKCFLYTQICFSTTLY